MLLEVYTKVDEHRQMLHQLAGEGDDEVARRLRLRAHALRSELETLRPLLGPEVGPLSNPADKPKEAVLRLIQQVHDAAANRPSLAHTRQPHICSRAPHGRARGRGRRPRRKARSPPTCRWR